MQKKIKSLNHRYFLGLGFIITLILMSVGFQKLNAQSTVKSEQRYYHEQMKAVSHNVETIQKIIDDPYALTDQEVLPLYEKQLDSIIDRCHDLLLRNKEAKEELKSISQESVDQCRQLISLVAYQKNLYGQFEAVLQIEAKKLPASNGPDFTARVSEIEVLLRQTYNNVSLISSATHDDQYKKEIEKTLTDLHKKAYGLQGSNNQISRQLFITHLEEVQNELMLYRKYFWNNVAIIDSLKEDIDKAL